MDFFNINLFQIFFSIEPKKIKFFLGKNKKKIEKNKDLYDIIQMLFHALVYTEYLVK